MTVSTGSIARRILQASVLGLALIAAPAQQSHIGNLTGDASRGLDSFTRYCAGCHGAAGNGKGTFAPYLEPRPRDMTSGIFKCRSTPSGSLPTDQDIYDTMVRGIVTTAMPIWRPLTPQQRVDMVAYVKKFHAGFATKAPPTPIEIMPETPVTIDSLKHGAQLYRQLECAKCHGPAGKGDGPDADTLLDIKHRPLPPYDFTVTSRFKCGSTNADLYRIYRTGMDGSSMPSYANKIDPAQTWDLVHYTRTLQVTRKSEENRLLKAAGGKDVLREPQVAAAAREAPRP